MLCEQCNGPGDNKKCCWGIAMEIQNFKRRVLRLFIIETIFDLIVSLASVVIDIVILIHYIRHGQWELALLTGLPVLLPTIVFTNVYMSDVSRGYCKLPKNRRKKMAANLKFKTQSQSQDGSQPKVNWGPYNCVACFSDNTTFKMKVRKGIKSMRKSFKYFWGTLILRFIAWSWYLKALIFGIKALRNPKKFLKVEQPDTHWTRDLLVRLDFFQASLENAPQCIIQMYALLSHPGENVILGLLALSLSFIDFIRVATTILWNINKGPVEAPENCYGTLIWQLMNVMSWVCLYVARCSAIGLIIGTVLSLLSIRAVIIIVPLTALVAHCTVFSVLVSKLKVGQASEKLAVTTFISIFFLPDLDSKNVHMMIQFYYAMIMLENTFFIIPWGWDLSFTGYCFARPNVNGTTISTTEMTEQKFWTPNFEGSAIAPLMARSGSGGSFKESDCLIDPVIVVIFVPSLTIIGIVLRLAAAKKMNHFKSTHVPPSNEKSWRMEERVAGIYSQKWTKMKPRDLWHKFMHILQKQVQSRDDMTSQHKILPNDDVINTIKLKDEFRNESIFMKKSTSAFDLSSTDKMYQNIFDKSGGLESQEKGQEVIEWDQNLSRDNFGQNSKRRKSEALPRQFFYPGSYGTLNDGRTTLNFKINSNFPPRVQSRFQKVENEGSVHIFETIHI